MPCVGQVMLIVPPLTVTLPLTSIASVSPMPMVMFRVPPFISKEGAVKAVLFLEAFTPSSLAEIVMLPSLMITQVPSMPSAEEMLNVPPSMQV